MATGRLFAEGSEMGDTSMRVSEETLDALHELKERGDTYEDVIWRLLEASPEYTDALRRSVGASERQADRETQMLLADLSEDQVKSHIRDRGVPGPADTHEQRVQAIYDLYEYLREHEQRAVPAAELKEVVDPADVGYQTVDSFWTNCVLKSENRSNALVALPGVAHVGNGRYRYSKAADPSS